LLGRLEAGDVEACERLSPPQRVGVVRSVASAWRRRGNFFKLAPSVQSNSMQAGFNMRLFLSKLQSNADLTSRNPFPMVHHRL
jgi:hypothetical protein